MAIKATLRRPTNAKDKAIEVEAKAVNNGVDDKSAEALADALDAGAPVPGSDEAIEKEMNDGGNSSAVATRKPTPLAVGGRYQSDSGGALEGDFNDSDLKLPQFKIVNGSGELSKKFNAGSLLLNDELLFEPPSPKSDQYPVLHFVPLKLSKYYRENLTQDQVMEGLMPRSVNSIQEAEELTGPGSAAWGPDKQKPLWSAAARCIFAIQEPENYEGENAEFNNLVDGKNYALAVHYSSGMSYRECGKKILNAASLALRERSGRIVLHKRLWIWKVVKRAFGTNQFTVFVPEIVLTKQETGPEMAELAARILGKNVKDIGE